MSKRPEQVKLSEVVALLEGAIAPVDCVTDPESCRRSGTCVTHDIWSEMKDAIDKTLNSITLQDLVEREREKELSAKGKISKGVSGSWSDGV
jgi:Rrf2 family protein